MQTVQVEPTLDRFTQSFTTCDVDFASVLVVDGSLALESWDIAPDGKRLEFRFSDPAGKGKALEIAFQRDSRDFRLFRTRKYLVNKSHEVLRPSGRR